MTEPQVQESAMAGIERYVVQQAGATWHVFDREAGEPLAFTVGYGWAKATWTADFLNQEDTDD